jgi:hypothetical protein
VPAHSQEGEAAGTAAAVASSSSRSRMCRVSGAIASMVGSWFGRVLIGCQVVPPIYLVEVLEVALSSAVVAVGGWWVVW